jgi:DNA-binding NarL/FixJ family response regulator
VRQKIRVMLVDDEVIVREALCALLEMEEHLALVGTADAAGAAVRQAQHCQPDVILLDMHLPDRSGVAVIPDLLRVHPTARIVLLTAYATQDEVKAAFRAGAVGYVFKTQAITELVRAIEQAAQEQSPPPPIIAHMMLRQFWRQSDTVKTPLSEAEMRLLPLVAQGYTNQEVARQLGVSDHTVRVQMRSIMTKLHLSSRTQVALHALKCGWVQLGAGSIHPQPAEHPILL